MHKECPQCKSEIISDSICLQCHSSIFIIPNNVDKLKNNNEYLSLVQDIVKKTNLKEQLVENLIKFNYINIIPKTIVNSRYLADYTLISIPEHIYDTQYQKHPFFIFSNFSSYNTKFSVKNIEIDDKDEGCFNLIVFSNNHSIKKQYLDLFLKPFRKPKINISLQYVESDTIPYDIKLLNSKELKKLKENLLEQSESHNIVAWSDSDIKNNCFFTKEIEVDFSHDPITIYKNIESEIDIFQNYVDSVIDNFKEQNKIIFERSLLELDIKNF